MSTSSNPVYDAAPELSKHASEIRKLCKRVYNDIVEIGERLIECERLCKAEGKWLQWLEHEFGWSRKTADRFIDIANAGDKVAKLATLDVPLSAIYLLARPQTPSEVIMEVEERSKRGETVTVAQVRELVTERAFGKESGEVHRIVAAVPSSPPPQRIVSLAALPSPERTTTPVKLDGEFAAAQHLVIAMEVYNRSATDEKIAKLKRAATELGRDRAAIRRIAEAIIDAFEADAGPATLSKIERRIAERKT